VLGAFPLHRSHNRLVYSVLIVHLTLFLVRLHKLLSLFVDLLLAIIRIDLIVVVLVLLDDALVKRLTAVLPYDLDPLTPLNFFNLFDLVFVQLVDADVHQFYVVFPLVLRVEITIAKEDVVVSISDYPSCVLVSKW
jgi:hypothetical protein